MTSYIENKIPLLHFSLIVITEISFILGLAHVYVIAVYVMDWRKGRTMSTSDQVIISIMISRMLLQFLIQLRLFWELFSTVYSPIYDLVIHITNVAAVYFSFWLSTLLGVVFYLKISNIHSVFFLWLRKIITERILYFIMASLLVSIGQTSLVHLVKHYFMILQNSTDSNVHQKNLTASIVFFSNMFGSLLIYLLSSLFLITSLYLHIRHMRCNRNVTSSLDPYYRIIKYIAGSLFTSVLCIIMSVFAGSFYSMLGFLLFCFPWTTFETLHSLLLIYVTPKLKNPLSRILKSLSNCWMKREEPGDIVMAVTTRYVDSVSNP